jgi:hypothetical protein
MTWRPPDISSSSGAHNYPTPPFLALILKTHNPRLSVPIASPLQAAEGPSLVPQPLYLPPPAMPDLEEDLVPPENFAVVTTGVYRCGFPKKRNFRFMETLKLRTILYVRSASGLTSKDARVGGLPRSEPEVVSVAGYTIHGWSPLVQGQSVLQSHDLTPS